MTNYLPGGMGGKDKIVVTPGPLLERFELEHRPGKFVSSPKKKKQCTYGADPLPILLNEN